MEQNIERKGNQMYKVYGDYKSGNCYKIKLILNQSASPYKWIPIDILNKESRSSEFLKKNPNGKIPVLEFPDGRILFESSAILHFLSDGTSFLPTDPYEHAQVLQWMAFEQYSHEPYIATARFIVQYLGNPPEQRTKLEEKKEPGYAALKVMEQHLQYNDFFVGNRYTIADIALYAYTHVAEEGEFDLSEFPAIRNWFVRVQNTTNFVTML